MRQIITFLGIHNPVRGPVQYRLHDQVVPGLVFAAAMQQLLAFDRMLVFTTPGAAAATWPILAALQDKRIVKVDIPDGALEDQMWELFEAVTSRVDTDDVVIFDITHGLRSIPFLTFLFAAYLKSAKNVTIEAIYYGALELQAENGGIAPVIDLSQFVAMLDWITATDQFVQTGNANRLAKLIQPVEDNQQVTKQAAEALSLVSRAAFLGQPFTLMTNIANMQACLDAAESELATGARPFHIVKDQIAAGFANLRCDSDNLQRPAEWLRAEFNMIEWYYDHQQYIQMLSLAREWLVDAITMRLGKKQDFKANARKPFEFALSGLPRVGGYNYFEEEGVSRIFTVDDLNNYGRKIYETWPEQKALASLWNSLSQVRNQIDHAEHRPEGLNSDNLSRGTNIKTIEKQAVKFMPKLRDLAKRWGLIDPQDTQEPPTP
jgi:CRISPR-associated DxTHG motif protein